MISTTNCYLRGVRRLKCNNLSIVTGFKLVFSLLVQRYRDGTRMNTELFNDAENRIGKQTGIIGMNPPLNMNNFLSTNINLVMKE
jgi:hypothetical protein